MSPEPKLQPLSYNKRTIVFILMCVTFFVLMPVFFFYATGYRIDFSDNGRSIVSVGGVYVSSLSDDTDIYINEGTIERMRFFSNAAYIQNLSAGKHRIHVQGEGLNTWVKELPVYEFLVTEVSSFTLPEVPQIRVVPEYVDEEGVEIIVTDTKATTSDDIFLFASSTTNVMATSSRWVSSLDKAPEHEYIAIMFASSTQSLLEQNDDNGQFVFEEFSVTNDVPTTTITLRDVTLYKDDEGLYAKWIGAEINTPFQYCINYLDAEQTILDYGEHVYQAFLDDHLDKIREADSTPGYDNICRNRIRIGGDLSDIHWFEFYPDSNDLVLILLDDGLYVIEVDDRGWQNRQLLYPGSNLRFMVIGNQIYVYDGQYYLEVFTDITA